MSDEEVYPAEVLAAIKNQLKSGYCRLEFSFAFGVKGTYQTVQVYAPGATERSKWVKVRPDWAYDETGRRAARSPLPTVRLASARSTP